jgi:hypothetical protein
MVSRAYEKRGKLKSAALAKGYDSLVLMTPKAFAEFKANGKLPPSMELNILVVADVQRPRI